MAYTKEIKNRRNEMFNAVEKMAKAGNCELSSAQIQWHVNCLIKLESKLHNLAIMQDDERLYKLYLSDPAYYARKEELALKKCAEHAEKLHCIFFYQTDYRGYMVHLLPKSWEQYDSEYIRSHYSPNSVPIGSQVW